MVNPLTASKQWIQLREDFRTRDPASPEAAAVWAPWLDALGAASALTARA